jgi:hypothetical protein
LLYKKDYVSEICSFASAGEQNILIEEDKKENVLQGRVSQLTGSAHLWNKLDVNW